PLYKKQRSGIRPIAIGEAWARAISRWALCSVHPESILLPEQFGVGTGTEPVIWSLCDSIDDMDNGLLQIDFANAFNTLSRHATAEAIRKSHASHLLGIYRF